MNNELNTITSHYIEQTGGRVYTEKMFYSDTAQNRKLKRVGKPYKYKHTYAKPGRKPRVWYTLINKKSPKKCPPNKQLSPKGNCVLKKCPSGKKLTLKGKCIDKPKKQRRISIYEAKELFDEEARRRRNMAKRKSSRRSPRKSARRSPRKSARRSPRK
tara:strand:- start:287 stop:760 length:474 start_codon:yes stop_codon:yes gene_type:complete